MKILKLNCKLSTEYDNIFKLYQYDHIGIVNQYAETLVVAISNEQLTRTDELTYHYYLIELLHSNVIHASFISESQVITIDSKLNIYINDQLKHVNDQYLIYNILINKSAKLSRIYQKYYGFTFSRNSVHLIAQQYLQPLDTINSMLDLADSYNEKHSIQTLYLFAELLQYFGDIPYTINFEQAYLHNNLLMCINKCNKFSVMYESATINVEKYIFDITTLLNTSLHNGQSYKHHRIYLNELLHYNLNTFDKLCYCNIIQFEKDSNITGYSYKYHRNLSNNILQFINKNMRKTISYTDAYDSIDILTRMLCNEHVEVPANIDIVKFAVHHRCLNAILLYVAHTTLTNYEHKDSYVISNVKFGDGSIEYVERYKSSNGNMSCYKLKYKIRDRKVCKYRIVDEYVKECGDEVDHICGERITGVVGCEQCNVYFGVKYIIVK